MWFSDMISQRISYCFHMASLLLRVHRPDIYGRLLWGHYHKSNAIWSHIKGNTQVKTPFVCNHQNWTQWIYCDTTVLDITVPTWSGTSQYVIRYGPLGHMIKKSHSRYMLMLLECRSHESVCVVWRSGIVIFQQECNCIHQSMQLHPPMVTW